jgi:predicted peptidase
MERENVTHEYKQYLAEAAGLPYLISIPTPSAVVDRWPVICFLHGYDEGPPTPIQLGLTRHGPLRPRSARCGVRRFIVVAPQLSRRGDLWYEYTTAVRDIVHEVLAIHTGDPERVYLTGFSFGGSGVFDLGIELRGFWAALWPVDPTRVPSTDPAAPVWLSSGAVSRHLKHAFVQRLGLEPPRDGTAGDRVYEDQGKDHVGTASVAYANDHIYEWLLTKRSMGRG